MNAVNPEASPLPRLEIGRYRLRFRPASAVPAGRYTGSAWRSVFGHALRKLTCTMRDMDCPQCLLYFTCVYSYLFETPPPGADKMRKCVAAPHPFVLSPTETADDDGYRLGVSLFGRANGMLAYVVESFAQAARRGLRPLRAPLELCDVEQQAEPGRSAWRSIRGEDDKLFPFPGRTPTCPPPPRRVRVVLITPLRLRAQEIYVRPDSFRFVHLFSNLLRRFSLLTYFHCDSPLETDFAGLVRRAGAMRAERADLRWHEWVRYSGRQNERLLVGGLLGSFELETTGFEALWPYLWLGQYTHAGKGATTGLGRYAILPSCPRDGKLAGDGTSGSSTYNCRRSG